ncbi:MobF family relaxase [Isoptericola hypogeus]|uniref:MobF family relaxase n=1 Tax=Isoptericola hypogeus TaxID=300179 RepID=UPI0031D4D4A6
MSHGGIEKIGHGNGGMHSAARDFARYLTTDCESIRIESVNGAADAQGTAGAYAGYAAEGAATVRHLAVALGSATMRRQITPGQLEAMLSWQGVDGTGEHGVPRSNSVLALDKTFNVTKELSILAGLDETFADVLEDAMHEAVSVTVEALAAESVSRVGPAGEQELVPVTWLEAAIAMHRTSRAGDPHWHAHTVIPTRVLVKVDGEERWAGLWTTPLFRDQRRLNRIFDAALTSNPRLRRALLERRASIQAGKVVGVDERVVAEFSRRHAQIDAAVSDLAADWRASHPGQTPAAAVVAAWRERAQKQTRAAKDDTRTLATLRAEWRARAHRLGWTGAGANGYTPFRLGFQIDLHEIAHRAIDRLGAERSRWHEGDIQAKVFDELSRADLVVRDPADLRKLGMRITDLVIAEYCLPILHDPAHMDQARRARVRAWTSTEVVRQEQELRARLASRAHADAAIELPWIEAVAACSRARLGIGQLVAAARIAGAESLVVVEGAAGTGKTTMLDTAVRTIHATGSRALVLAPSATAAKVAGEETRTTASTLHRFLRAHGYVWSETEPLRRLPPEQRPIPAPDSPLWLRPGDVVIVDEAGMADQDTMRAVLTIADETPAVRIRLVGDRAQLRPVGKGGVLAMAADVVPVTDLKDVHRFRQPWWNALTLLIRDRDPRSFDHLLRAGAFVAGRDQEVTATRFAHDLVTDLLGGSDALGIVATNEQAAVTNTRVQAALVAAGRVRPDAHRAIPGRDGLTAGIGDRITTRANDGDIEVLNRQTWTVTGHGPDGALRVRGKDGQRRSLPATYVHRSTHLAYAVTGYGAQGLTVEVARVLADDASGAVAYVGATRGREANFIYLTASDAAEARQVWAEVLADDADDGITIEAFKTVRELAALGLRQPTRRGTNDPAATPATRETLASRARLLAGHRHGLPRPTPPRRPKPEPESPSLSCPEAGPGIGI